jgi:hypothetical protein
MASTADEMEPVLRIGDPDLVEDGASFTLFVLPFRYAPQRVFYSNDNFYKLLETSKPWWVNRERYFTSETAQILFHHARWFEMAPEQWLEFDFPKDFILRNRGRQISVGIDPPRLVLFEWNGDACKEGDSCVFNTGFLLLRLHFPFDQEGSPRYSDLLALNEKFRYWRSKYDGHYAAEIESSISIPGFDEPFGYFLLRWQRLLSAHFVLPEDDRQWRLFPLYWQEQAEEWWCRELVCEDGASVGKEHSGWIFYSDDRAFVWTCAVVQGGWDGIWAPRHGCGSKEPHESGRWIRLLNVDAPAWNGPEGDDEATVFESEWARDKDYRRWLHYGTLYGFNYHCGAMVCGPNKNPPIARHFEQNYFDIVLLLLYLRLTLFRFSRDLCELSADTRKKGEGITDKDRERFETLRENFVHFTNLYH